MHDVLMEIRVIQSVHKTQTLELLHHCAVICVEPMCASTCVKMPVYRLN